MKTINKQEIENIVVEKGGPYSAIEYMIRINYPNIKEVVKYIHTIRYFDDEIIKKLLK